MDFTLSVAISGSSKILCPLNLTTQLRVITRFSYTSYQLLDETTTHAYIHEQPEILSNQS